MKQLTPRDLLPGMVTAVAVTTPHGQELASTGTELTRQLINKIKLYKTEFVYVEIPDEPTIMELAPAAPDPDEPVQTHIEKSKTHSQKVHESAEFHDFQLEYSRVMAYLQDVFSGVIHGANTIDEAELVQRITPLFITRNTITEVFDMLHQMRSLNDSVYAHCINVALISRMIGRWLHLDSKDLDTLTCCGLLHDIGKALIPDEILNKPGKLNPQEFQVIKSHPKLGYEVLRSQNIDTRIKQVVLMHHERNDGSGYPNGLTGELLADFAMIVAIADVYDAMTAARSYRVPLSPFEVIGRFEEEGFQKYNPKYIYTFLHRIAATYEGNRVLLNDGRACKIVMLNQNNLSRPIVQFDNGEYLDLSTNREVRITKIL